MKPAAFRQNQCMHNGIPVCLFTQFKIHGIFIGILMPVQGIPEPGNGAVPARQDAVHHRIKSVVLHGYCVTVIFCISKFFKKIMERFNGFTIAGMKGLFRFRRIL